MASRTKNLNLLKMDPTTDGSSTFNIKAMLNDNWDAVDEAVGDRETLLKDKADITAPADDDNVPVVELAGTVKKISWLRVKTLLKQFFDLEYAGLSHKARHATGGADALTPGDIGALGQTGDGSGVSVIFTPAQEKKNINSGMTLATALGTIATWFSSFGSAAWKNVGTTASAVAAGNHTHSYAPSGHKHTKSDITDFPSSMAPTAHKATHSKDGADALSPSDIGAARSWKVEGALELSGWVQSGTIYVYELAASGVAVGDSIYVHYVSGEDVEAGEVIREAFGVAISAGNPKISAGKITFRAKEAPTVNVPVFYSVVKG